MQVQVYVPPQAYRAGSISFARVSASERGMGVEIVYTEFNLKTIVIVV